MIMGTRPLSILLLSMTAREERPTEAFAVPYAPPKFEKTIAAAIPIYPKKKASGPPEKQLA